ncbi:helix-turn-helix domain-containing protein [Scandinavium goeteborgense]|uniref:helix-turn-helix domain-containing protein n=1 Tax=Scandinavium goeteborgense TaxID=1851514 RepID=UPI0021650443|nr:helix-turn-helix domain-containing protein [Scandinavium goeteborgense]MCS2153785.1 helix-turn-helix domain-containing protein [Scandinavium goeteborgense]
MKSNKNSGANIFTPGAKPIEAINRLIEVCRPCGTLIDTHATLTDLSLTGTNGEQQVLVLLEGVLSIIRNSDQLLYAVVPGPTFIGVLASDYRKHINSFYAMKGSVVMMLPRDTVIELITKHGLVRELLDYYRYINDYQNYLADLMISRSTYEIVCGLLNELALLPPESRKTISVSNYIVNRTHLARSGIMKMLSDLRLGGYIDIQNGKLKEIKKTFPAKY